MGSSGDSSESSARNSRRPLRLCDNATYSFLNSSSSGELISCFSLEFALSFFLLLFTLPKDLPTRRSN